jgi:DNA helicase-2/ATP-dependent DNA helicase PcrA
MNPFSEFDEEFKNVKPARVTPQQEFPLETYKPTHTPSKYQEAVYDWIKTGTGNAVVVAVAGSGKTTTILDALHLTSGKVLFTAFNAHIAAELQKRSPPHVRVMTLHSLGLKSCKRSIRGCEVDAEGEKLGQFTEQQFPDTDDMEKTREMRSIAKRLVSLAKSTLIDVGDPDQISDMADYYRIASDKVDEMDMGEIFRGVSVIVDCCKTDASRVDFDDMTWLPVVLGLQVETFDWVFVDECQDMNECQLELVHRTAGPRTRFVCVGDRNQAIYGFRGADARAMESTIERLKAKVFPLSITYRCPTKHVELARKLVPEIEARPGAPDGKVIFTTLEAALPLMAQWDLVLCRTNAPLVKVAFSLIRLGKKAVIRGRDIGAGICSLIRKISRGRIQSMSMENFLEKLEAYYQKESARLLAKKKSTVTLSDQVETVEVLSEGVSNLQSLIDKTLSIFDDKAQGIVCSSVHKAKGLEANRVFIVKPELMPHPMADQPWELEQETHIKYVALTRAKDEMYFVSMPDERGGGRDLR